MSVKSLIFPYLIKKSDIPLQECRHPVMSRKKTTKNELPFIYNRNTTDITPISSYIWRNAHYGMVDPLIQQSQINISEAFLSEIKA